MPHWPHSENTGRTAENCKNHPDGRPCPSCNSTKTKFRFLNNKKTTQPRYQCLKCKKAWTQEGNTRVPYKRSEAVNNPVVAEDAAQPPPITNPVEATDAPSQPPPPIATAGVRNENTGRSIENCKAHPDYLPCPSCNSTETKFRFLNNKQKTQPRYRCLKCKKMWTEGGKTRGPYKKRGGIVSNPRVAADATTSLPPPTAIPAAAHCHRSSRIEVKEVDPKQDDMELKVNPKLDDMEPKVDPKPKDLGL